MAKKGSIPGVMSTQAAVQSHRSQYHDEPGHHQIDRLEPFERHLAGSRCGDVLAQVFAHKRQRQWSTWRSKRQWAEPKQALREWCLELLGQTDLILKIVDEHKLEKAKVEGLARDRFGKTVKALNKLEASGLIEELLEMTDQSKGRSRFQGRYQRAGGRATPARPGRTSGRQRPGWGLGLGRYDRQTH